MSIISHLEKNLGLIEEGWSLTNTSSHLQVVRFPHQPSEETSTFSSIGLSSKQLTSPCCKNIRLELLLISNNNHSKEDVAKHLLGICHSILLDNSAPLRGHAIKLPEEIIKNSKLDAIYFTTPNIFPSDLSSHTETSPHTVLVWAIPITRKEADYVNSYGWNAFEDLLEKTNPCLSDLERQSLV